MTRPAVFSSPEPPVSVESVVLHEYIQALRRRIEVQNDLLSTLSDQLNASRHEIDKLSLDLAIKEHRVPDWDKWQDRTDKKETGS